MIKQYITLLIFIILVLKYGAFLETRIPCIAIIGGGIGGASTSHFLTELFNGSLKIDLYEAKTIGGRLATVKIDNNEIEAGGAIIHSKNMYMQKFVKLLGLEHISYNKLRHGIWNGDKFIFKESAWYIISLTKLFYRYGFQVYKLKRHVDDIVKKFGNIYNVQDEGKSFLNVTALLSAMNKEFPRLLQLSVKDHLSHMGFTERLIDEIVQATTVVNYGQDVNIQSFVGLISLAGADRNLWSVKGGNKAVPKYLIYRNKYINIIPSRVTKIRNMADSSDSSRYEVTYMNKDSTDSMTSTYDIVIIATPLTHDQEFPIKFVDFPDNLVFPGNYQTTYATFINGDLNLKYFCLQEKALNIILSCNPNKTKISSIGKVSSVDGSTDTSSQIWKIFSREPLVTNLINRMFSHVVEKKEIPWKAYPHYLSTTNVHFDKFKLHDSLYHINAIEWAGSAMEISAIAGRNVAILAHDDFIKNTILY